VDFLEPLAAWGSHWLVLLIVASLIAATPIEEGDRLRRWQLAFSTRGFQIAATVLAVLAWIEHVFRLTLRGDYLLGSGSWLWLPALLIALLVLLLVTSWLGLRFWRVGQPWFFLFIHVALIIAASAMLEEGLEKSAELHQYAEGNPTKLVLYVQDRLDSFNCYPPDTRELDDDGRFTGYTASAAKNFQLANGLVTHPSEPRPRPSDLGGIREEKEWRYLKQPFPRLAGVRGCDSK